MNYLSFDASDNADGVITLEALASTPAAGREAVLAEVQRQVELMLEYRVREVLTPLLNRAADTIVREARNEGQVMTIAPGSASSSRSDCLAAASIATYSSSSSSPHSPAG